MCWCAFLCRLLASCVGVNVGLMKTVDGTGVSSIRIAFKASWSREALARRASSRVDTVLDPFDPLSDVAGLTE